MTGQPTPWTCPGCEKTYKIPAGKAPPERCPDCVRVAASLDVLSTREPEPVAPVPPKMDPAVRRQHLLKGVSFFGEALAVTLVGVAGVFAVLVVLGFVVVCAVGVGSMPDNAPFGAIAFLLGIIVVELAVISRQLSKATPQNK